MIKDLVARFSAVDDLSDKLEEMAEKGQAMSDAISDGGDAASAALAGMDDTAEKVGASVSEMSEAASKAAEGTDDLGEAANKAAKETEELGKKSEETGDKATKAITAIASTLIAKEIAKKVKEIAEAVYEMAEAFSEAEKIIVSATGATGSALQDLENSMLNAYAANDNALSEVAGAVGEINTRMGLTGTELTDVTNLFLDFADVTNSNVVGSVQNVTKMMNKWGIEGRDLENTMDKLVYSTQHSGASMENLISTLITGAASFQSAGMSIDNAIQMLTDFELAGINGSTAIRALRTAVNHFAKEGVDANTAIQETIAAIAAMEDQTEATVMATEVFGNMAGVELVSAIQNGTITVETFSATLDEAAGTMSKTAEASESLAEKWQKANNSMKAAFTKALGPTIDAISSGFANTVTQMGNFLNKHPAVAKAISALAIGFGAMAIGVAAFAFATTVAIPAIEAFGAAIDIAALPLLPIALAISGITAAVLFLSDSFGGLDDETADMTATTRAQYFELQRLNIVPKIGWAL